METVIDLLFEYKMYVGLGIVVLIGLFCLFSKTLRGQLKNGAILLLILAAIGGGYYLVTGKSPSHIPGSINSFFNKQSTKVEPSHRYYQDRREHYEIPSN